ncbi:MAG: ATP-dependent sacrificial sulfur transferase LarE [Chloroflexi bacterium]|nr:ATP-dependent sacrificial sulfur transferase LarE [Chloroflexota bacterium]
MTVAANGVSREKLRRLASLLLDLDSVVVAYSGGVDSTLLLRLCRDALGDRVLAVTAHSPAYPADELAPAAEVAKSLSVRHLVIQTAELDDPRFVANPPDRCYHCKLELFGRLKGIAAADGLKSVVDGSNCDDLSDHRPGSRAAAELAVRHPLQEAGLTKEEIRALSRELGLGNWNKPSLACLASRVPYGTPITRQALAAIDAAEGYLRRLGIWQVRVRHHGDTARIEVEHPDMAVLLDQRNREGILAHFRGLGYLRVTVDLAGYRCGSMNDGVIA